MSKVLILLFLECGLRPKGLGGEVKDYNVLILLFLECGLRLEITNDIENNKGLNPTFSGMWSATKTGSLI